RRADRRQRPRQARGARAELGQRPARARGRPRHRRPRHHSRPHRPHRRNAGEMSAAVEFKDVDIVFGREKAVAAALPFLDSGADRATILAKTGAVLGCAGCNLTVEKGEISVLMGLSGSGKSTLLRAVNRLNTVTRGAVVVHDGDWQANVVTCPESQLRKIRRECVAMVFQQFALLPWRTVAE